MGVGNLLQGVGETVRVGLDGNHENSSWGEGPGRAGNEIATISLSMVRYRRRLANNKGEEAGRARLVWWSLGARTDVAWYPSKSRVHADRAMPHAWWHTDVAPVTRKIERQARQLSGGATIWRV